MRFFLFISITAVLFAFGIPAKESRHVGKWKITNQSEAGQLIFDSLGFASMIIEKDTIGGKEFNVDGNLQQMKYVMNYNNTPHTIDLIISNKTTGKKINTILGIFEFTPSGGMKMFLNYSEPVRPKFFNPEFTIELEKLPN
jgi:uncharacterized protein (TIGR03067 family)